ncbi:MAG TPA: DUF1846 family protein [Candidatus Woesebacteria bacterium]|nr:DUF1846 family protein [Candidatus Woesebacteria bacterium]
MEKCFDTKKYLKIQKKAIEERLSKFSDRLYLEFGGKFIDDFHAVRTLPGYEANTKLKLLLSLKRDLGVIYCVSAKQLSEGKIRGDFGIGYDVATIKAVNDLKNYGLKVEGVVINRFNGEKEALLLIRQLEEMGVKVITRGEIKNYPNDIDLILSKNGFGKDNYLEVKNKLIVVWGAGPGSGKLSTCLGQIYHEIQRGENSGYAKFETFPVWNMEVEHPVNIAYEAATADLGDYNLIDPWHMKAYGIEAVNYNRDVESFPIIKKIFSQMLAKDNFSNCYQSPTDMGFNCLKSGIVDNEKIVEAAKKEINFYLFRYREEYKKGLVEKITLERMEELMTKIGIDEEYLITVKKAREVNGAAIELTDGRVITGKNSKFLTAFAAVLLNAVKTVSGIDDKYHLISPSVIAQIIKLNRSLGKTKPALNGAEIMLAWAISARDNPLAKKALSNIFKIKGCYLHAVDQPVVADKELFRKLGVWLSSDGQ